MIRTKFYSAISLFIVLVIILCNQSVVNSKIQAPPAASSNNPATNKSCAQTDCHPGPAEIANGEYTIKIGTSLAGQTDLTSSFIYTPGTTYFMSLLINSVGGNYGFQLIGQDASDNQAGTFIATDATHTFVTTQTSTGKEFMGHRDAAGFKNWVFKWTAPSTDVGPITFYSAINLADGDSSETGDVIYTKQITINSVSAINETHNFVNQLNIFPNPVESNFSISGFLIQATALSIQLYSLDGKLMTHLFENRFHEGAFNQNLQIDDIPQGVYLLKLNSGTQSVTQKIFKL